MRGVYCRWSVLAILAVQVALRRRRIAGERTVARKDRPRQFQLDSANDLQRERDRIVHRRTGPIAASITNAPKPASRLLALAVTWVPRVQAGSVQVRRALDAATTEHAVYEAGNTLTGLAQAMESWLQARWTAMNATPRVLPFEAAEFVREDAFTAERKRNSQCREAGCMPVLCAQP